MESEFQLSSGVSLYRIHLRRPTIPNVPEPVLIRKTTSAKTMNSSTSVVTNGIPVVQVTSDTDNASDSSPITSPRLNPNQLSVPSSSLNHRRHGIILSDHSGGSSEETGFDTDTGDEQPPQSAADPMSSSYLSEGDAPNDLPTEVSEISSEKNTLFFSLLFFS